MAGVREIVIRDFNLKDNQITMYLSLPDGDYYMGCGFRAMQRTASRLAAPHRHTV